MGRNRAIRKNSKTGVTAPSGHPGQSLLRKFKQPVNTEFFTEKSQSSNFAARLELLEQRQETVPASAPIILPNGLQNYSLGSFLRKIPC